MSLHQHRGTQPATMAFIPTCVGLTVASRQVAVSPHLKHTPFTAASTRRLRPPSGPMKRTLPSMAENSPINAPSSVLLLLSSVLAIASVGSVFELSGGHPQYGSTFTSAVLAVSLPGFLFLFYSAIRKGQQEALDDP